MTIEKQFNIKIIDLEQLRNRRPEPIAISIGESLDSCVRECDENIPDFRKKVRYYSVKGYARRELVTEPENRLYLEVEFYGKN